MRCCQKREELERDLHRDVHRGERDHGRQGGAVGQKQQRHHYDDGPDLDVVGLCSSARPMSRPAVALPVTAIASPAGTSISRRRPATSPSTSSIVAQLRRSRNVVVNSMTISAACLSWLRSGADPLVFWGADACNDGCRRGTGRLAPLFPGNSLQRRREDLLNKLIVLFL